MHHSDRPPQTKVMSAKSLLSIGEVARRTGVRVSAVRFYADKGLLRTARSRGGSRLFPRAEIRRLSFILIAQQLGLSLDQIGEELQRLPQSRTPSAKDWAAIAGRLRAALDAKIQALTRTRDTLSGCIGCGCLSLKACAIYNPDDRAARKGPGPRFALHGEKPD